jgi:TRAP-type mannitol/chloroaromatic compound transport system permease small subunit
VHALLAVSRLIDSINLRLGKWVSWLIVVVVIVSSANAVSRKLFGLSSNAWLELQWIMFSVIFMACSPWTLMSNEHIRIDIVNSMFPKGLRNWIDVIGHAFFLIPMAALIVYLSWPFFWLSFMQNEQSTNAGGLAVYPSKFLIPLGFALLLVQGFSELIKRVAIITGDLEDTTSGGGHHAAVEAETERLLQVAREEAERRSG